MPSLRKILFFIFVLVYIIICPLIIFRTLGLVFISKGEESILQTGLISVSTIPAGATIHLNEKMILNKTPAMIQSLTPGHYTLNLSLPQYRPWEKDVSVIQEQATALEHVILIPEEWKVWEHSTISFEQILPLPGNPFLLAFSGPLLKDIFIFHWQEGLTETLLPAERVDSNDLLSAPLFPAGSAFSDSKLISIYTVRESSIAVLRIKSESQEKFLWVDLKNKQPKL